MVLLVVSGCTPRLTPLYRDYDVVSDTVDSVDTPDAELIQRIERSLEAASWKLVDGATDNVVATAPRTFRRWFIYDVEVEMEILPMGGEYVRMLINPYRVFFTGKRRQIPYLRRSLARSAFRDLNKAFEAEGLVLVGTAQSRDKEARGD